MATAALKIEGLKKVYANGVEALKGVSLEIPEGDFFLRFSGQMAPERQRLSALAAGW